MQDQQIYWVYNHDVENGNTQGLFFIPEYAQFFIRLENLADQAKPYLLLCFQGLFSGLHYSYWIIITIPAQVKP